MQIRTPASELISSVGKASNGSKHRAKETKERQE